MKTECDRDEFVDLLIQHYDDLESEYQATVPLKRVYIPSQGPHSKSSKME